MNKMSIEKNTFQVKIWALIGPLICMLAFFVMFLKSQSTPIFYPIILLFGVPISARWRLGGVSALVLVLGVSLSYYYLQIPIDQRFWYLGMSSSIAMSLLIVALCFEEVDSIIESIQLESSSRLENLLKLDEKHGKTEEELIKSIIVAKELENKLRSYQKIVDMSSEQLIQARTNYVNLSKDIYQGKEGACVLPLGKMEQLTSIQETLDKNLLLIKNEKVEVDKHL